jgi:hypothetical protein
MPKFMNVLLLAGTLAYPALSFADANITLLSFAESSVSRFGNLTIKHSDESGDKLYLNSTPIDLGSEGNSYTLALLNKINFAQNEAYIVLGGSGGTMDMDSNIQCKVVQVSSVKQYTVSVLTYCPIFNSPSLSLESDMLFVKFSNSAPYAESADFGIWQFDPVSNRIKIIHKLKSETYYKQKFSNYTPAQIYREAQQDGNIDPTTKLVSTCHICGMYGQKYCFKFQSLVNPQHDNYYTLLQKSCAN